MTYPIRQPPDGDTAWGPDARAAIAGVNDHQTRVTALEASSAYRTVQDEGTARTQRATLDFVGNGVTATDDAANNRTLVTIPASGSSPITEALSAGVPFDGTTDARTSLNTLLAGLPDGAHVAFPPGLTARLSANVVVPSGVDGITIDGRGSTLKLDAGAANSAYCLLLSGSGIKVKNLILDGSAVVNNSGIRINGNQQTVDGCKFINGWAGGVRILGASKNIRIINSEFGEGYGILTEDPSTASSIVIANNHFIGSAHGDAIEINTPASASTGAHDIVITGNMIADYTDSTSATGIGIGVANASNVSITGNTVLNCKLDGIHIEDSCVGVTISGNSIKGTGRSGIAVNVGAGTVPPKAWTISGNDVVGCGTASGDGGIAIEGIVSVRNGTISGNSVRNCGRAGYGYYSGIFLGYQSKDIVCTGNYVSGTIATLGAGIGWNTGEAFTVTGNICQDRGGTTQDYGIRVEGDQINVVIAANILTQNATAAIDEANIGTSATTTYYKYLNMPNTVNRAPA